MKKIKIFLIVIVSMNINLFAQKDSTYTDLELAIQNPQNVKNLVLKIKIISITIRYWFIRKLRNFKSQKK